MRGRDAKILADIQLLNSISTNNATTAEATRNQFEAKVARRNQVLFCVGYFDKDEFRYSDIEAFVRQRFPNTNQGVALNVTNAISELAHDDTGILKRTPNGDAYMLKHPIFRTCLRNILQCPENSEKVEKIDISSK